jgi:hypothetical protein
MSKKFEEKIFDDINQRLQDNIMLVYPDQHVEVYYHDKEDFQAVFYTVIIDMTAFVHALPFKKIEEIGTDDSVKYLIDLTCSFYEEEKKKNE